MKNLKKLLAVLVVVTLLATSMIPAFAAGSYTYTTQAQALYDLGLYKGSSTTSFVPDLGSSLDRQMGVVMLIRLLGKESAALALTSTEVNATLIIFSDADKLASWAKKHIAYAVLYKYVAGLPNGTFAPNNALTGKEYCTMLLRALGYTVDAAGYAGACYQLNLVGGITFSEAAKFNEKELTRDDMVGISFGVLKTDYKATKKSIIETMVETGIVTEAKAIASGAYNIKLDENAEIAITAYEAAPIGNLTEVAAAEAKKAAADTAVAKITAASKAAFQKRIDTKTAAIAAAKTAFNNADAAEAAAIAAAETAVKAFEAASIATTADVTAAEALSATATEKANLVKTEASKTAFLGRIAAQVTVVAARKADLAVIADATTATNSYVAAVYATLANITDAEKLEVAAEVIVAKIVDTAVKADLTKKIDDQSKLVAAKKVELTGAVVAAVTTNNLRTAVLTFDKAMDAATIITANVKVDGTGATTANMSLSEDKKVLTIAYAAPKTHGSSVTIALSNLKDIYGVAMASYSQSFVVLDITNPAITAVAVESTKSLKIYTTEPLNVDTGLYFKTTDYTNSAITLKVAGNLSFAKFTTDAAKGYTLVEFFNTLPLGVSEITIADAKDALGFKVAAYTGQINVVADIVALVAQSVEYVAKNSVKVTFSEPVVSGTFKFKEAGFAEVAATATYSGSTATLTFTPGMTIASTVGYDVTYTDVKDAAGNKVTGTISGSAPDDTTKPTVASFAPITGNKVKVVFSEPVNATIANFKLFASDGTTDKSTVTDSVVSNTAGTEFTITFTALAQVNVGGYVLKITNVTDESIRVNTMDAFAQPIVTLDNKVPTLASAIGKTIASGKQIVEVNFSEAMDTTLLANASNYFVGTTNIQYQLSLVSGATVVVNSSTKVTLTIPNATVNPYDVIATPVMKDSLGNLISGSTIAIPNPINAAYTNVLAANLAVTATGTTTIKVAINQSGATAGYTFSTADANAFKFTATGAQVYNVALGVIAAQISSDGTYVTLTTSVPLNVNATLTNPTGCPVGIYNDVRLWIDGSTVKDQNGQAISIASVDKISVVDKMGATQLAPTASGKVITVAFDEAIQCTVAGSLESAFTLKNGTTTLIPFVDYTAAITADGKIEITVTKIAGVTYAGEKTINVYLSNKDNIKDLAGNGVTVSAAKDVKVTQ